MNIKKQFIRVLIFMAISVSLQPVTAGINISDSLLILLQKHPENDTVRANLLIQVANSLYRSNPEESLDYAHQLEEMGLTWQKENNRQSQKYLIEAWLLKGKNYLTLEQNVAADSVFSLAIELSRKNKDKNMEAKTQFKIGKIWHSFSGYNEALDHYDQSYSLEESMESQLGMGISLYQMASASDDLGDFLTAIDYNQRAYDIFNQLGDEKRMAMCLNNFGNYQNSMGNYPQALEYFHQSLKINERLENDVEISNNLNNIGVVYMIMEKPVKAREYYQRSYEIGEKLGDNKRMMSGLGNIGISYSYEEDFEKALEYFNRVIQISQDLGDKAGIARTYGNIGRVYEDMKDYPQAIHFYSIALAINDSVGNKFGMIYNMIGLGDVYRHTGNINSATRYLHQGRSLANKIGAVDAEKDALQGLTEMYDKLKRFDSAYFYFKQYTDLKDTMLNEERIEEVTRKEMQYSFDKKMLAEGLKSEIEINRQKNRKNIFLFAGLGFLILAGGIWSRLRYIKKSKSIIEKEKERSETLLLNILPAEVAEELKEKGYADARQFDEVTVLFTDFKGFTQMAEKLGAQELVNEIDFCFKKFDEITSKYHIEKIKTIGDAYMCAGGLPVPNQTNPHDVVLAALEIQQFMEEMKINRQKEKKTFFELRIGIHTGPVVAGIVGIKKFQYDIWGDTVNIASHMETSCEVGKVNISHATFEHVKDKFICQHRGKVEAKNKGMIDMYFVDGTIS